MKNLKKQSLAEFENYLLQSMKERPKVPFSTKEVLQILKQFDPPDNLKSLSDENIVHVMKKEAEKQEQLEKKLKNYSLIQSLGELIKSYRDVKNISPIRLAQAIGFSKQELDNYETDQVAPESLQKEVLLKLMLFIGIPINEMILIVQKTVNQFQTKQGKSISADYDRIYARQKGAKQMRVRDGEIQNLQWSLKDGDDTEIDKLEQLTDDLVTEYQKIQSEYVSFDKCYTIRTKERSDIIDSIVQQL